MITCPHCSRKRRKGNSCKGCGRVDLDTLRSIMVSYQVNPSRMNNVAPSTPNNSFEKGIRKDERGLPYLDTNGVPLRMKESFNKRHYSGNSIKVSTNGR